MKDVVALDSTLLHYDGKWWLFTILVEHEGAAAYDELFLFYADSPVADYWHRHPDSPIVSDARRARPAGRIFEHRGELVRPAQDCGPRYGYGLRFHRIQELSVSAYAETEIATAEPRWHSRIKAVHTFAYTGHLTMIDAAWQRPRHLPMPARTTSTRPAHEC
jgi:hypothetical protein